MEWLEEWDRFTNSEEWLSEVERHTDAYLECIIEEANAYPNTAVLVEQKLDTGVEGVWGTSDTVLISPTNITVVDLKYGAGVRVDAEKNNQLRLYATGALNELGDILGETETVKYVVFQPRIGDGHVSSETTTVEELRSWVEDVVRPAAKEALSGEGVFKPTEKGCRWCPASGTCRAQMEEAFAEPLEDPATLSPAEISDALDRVPAIKLWLSGLEAAALQMSYTEGVAIPGRKVVQSGGMRKILDQEGAINALAAVGWEKDKVAPRKILGITALEKLLGGDDFNIVLGEFVGRTSGRPSLVSNSDPRPAINRNLDAASVFGAVGEDDDE